MNPRRKKAKKLTVKMGLIESETGEAVFSEREIVTSDEMIEASVIVDKLARSYHHSLEFYRRHCELTAEEARKVVDGSDREQVLKIARESSPREISWHYIGVIAEDNLKEGLEVWERVRIAAVEDYESGAYLDEVIGHGSPIEKSRVLHIRDSFIDGWQPRHGIEKAMIDILVETFILFQYWMAIAHQRAVHDHDRQTKDVRRWEEAKWKSPYQSEADAIDQAHRLADSYNRMFLRTLRQMRDLRRYPVIINNPAQVNVGNQQVNVAQNRAGDVS